MKHIFYIIILLVLIVIFGIIIKRHHYDQQTDSCLNARKAMLAQTPKPANVYIPQCTIFGNYISQQCNQNTGECWCVTPNGKEIVGTKTSQGQQPAACPLNWFYRYYRQLQ
jgi:hypothetical protein